MGWICNTRLPTPAPGQDQHSLAVKSGETQSFALSGVLFTVSMKICRDTTGVLVFELFQSMKKNKKRDTGREREREQKRQRQISSYP